MTSKLETDDNVTQSLFFIVRLFKIDFRKSDNSTSLSVSGLPPVLPSYVNTSSRCGMRIVFLREFNAALRLEILPHLLHGSQRAPQIILDLDPDAIGCLLRQAR